MMTIEQQHLQSVQGIYAAFGRGDIPTVLSALADTIEWQVTGPAETAYTGTRRGKPQVLEFFVVLGQTVEIQEFEPREFIVQGETVVVIGHERMKIKATGRVAENDWVMVFTIHDGQVVRFREYDDTAAVAAAFQRG